MGISSKDDLNKPSVEVTDAGLTDAETAKAWQEAAFTQARRAETLRTKLEGIRQLVDEALRDDADEVAKRDDARET